MGREFRRYGLISIIVTALAYLGVAWLFDWRLYFEWLAALSVTTFLLYGLDKLEAVRLGQAAKHRVPENLFHLLTLLGGFPGGWIGRFVFWHKIRKPIFWWVLLVATALHLTFVFLVFSGEL